MSTAEILPFVKDNTPRFECSACGEPSACNCGAKQVPLGTRAKLERAAAAIAANPDKSNRVIADDIGVDETTVRRARMAASSGAASDAAPEKRTGRDGKQQSATKRRKLPDARQAKAPPPSATDAKKSAGKLYGRLGDFMMEFQVDLRQWLNAHGSDPELRRYLTQGIDVALDALRSLKTECRNNRRK